MWFIIETLLEALVAMAWQALTQGRGDRWTMGSTTDQYRLSSDHTGTSNRAHALEPLLPATIPEWVRTALDQGETVKALVPNPAGDILAVTEKRSFFARVDHAQAPSLSPITISSITRLEAKAGSSGYSLTLATESGLQTAFMVPHEASQSLLKVAGLIRAIQKGRPLHVPQPAPANIQEGAPAPAVMSTLVPRPTISPQPMRSALPSSPFSTCALNVGGGIYDEIIISAMTQAMQPGEQIGATVAGAETTSWILTTSRLLVISTRLIGDPLVHAVPLSNIADITPDTARLTLTLKDGTRLSINVIRKYYNQLNEFAARLRARSLQFQTRTAAA